MGNEFENLLFDTYMHAGYAKKTADEEIREALTGGQWLKNPPANAGTWV